MTPKARQDYPEFADLARRVRTGLEQNERLRRKALVALAKLKADPTVPPRLRRRVRASFRRTLADCEEALRELRDAQAWLAEPRRFCTRPDKRPH